MVSLVGAIFLPKEAKSQQGQGGLERGVFVGVGEGSARVSFPVGCAGNSGVGTGLVRDFDFETPLSGCCRHR